ncbi:MAG TPA: hypothetical protein VG712_00590 [Gemmatimonadales bacterium]|nr:hypothetical protein [Gemmatimonadales bacterium]
MKQSLLLLALAGVCPAAAAAQNCNTPNGQANASCSVNISSSLTIPLLFRLTIDDTSSTITPPTPADYDAGSAVTAGPNVTIKTNGNWTLLVRATTATWTASGVGARANKPVGDLRWGTSPGGPFTAMTTANVSIATGTRGAANLRTMYYQVIWSWPLDTPGTYRLTVVYTATSP